MTRSSFAPELSATFTRVSCWTIRLLGLLHDLEHSPALLLGEGARLGDADEVAHAALVLLVVDLEARPLADGLAVQAVGLGRPDLDDDGLVHLVGDDGAEADLAPAADLRRGGGCVAHSASFLRPRPRLGLGSSSTSAAGSCSAFASGSASATAPSGSGSAVGPKPKSRSRSTVMMRAMSCRTLEIWLAFSSWPTACLNRSSYSSRRAVRRRMPSSSASRIRSSSTFISGLPRRR